MPTTPATATAEQIATELFEDLNGLCVTEGLGRAIGKWMLGSNPLQREVTLEFLENGIAASLGLDQGELGDLGKKLAAETADYRRARDK